MDRSGSLNKKKHFQTEISKKKLKFFHEIENVKFFNKNSGLLYKKNLKLFIK